MASFHAAKPPWSPSTGEQVLRQRSASANGFLRGMTLRGGPGELTCTALPNDQHSERHGNLRVVRTPHIRLPFRGPAAFPNQFTLALPLGGNCELAPRVIWVYTLRIRPLCPNGSVRRAGGQAIH